jgi:cysteinyl-tRNA synthetase
MTIRFFILQAHYRSTVDFSNEALQAAEKGLQRLMEGMSQLEKLKPGNTSGFNIPEFRQKCYDALNDDLNSPILIAHLFEGVKTINSIAAGKMSLTSDDLAEFSSLMHLFVEEILGLTDEKKANNNSETLDGLMQLILDIRQQAKNNKDWGTSDKIRDELSHLGIIVKDGKEGATWELK